jgi:hypothetical protein
MLFIGSFAMVTRFLQQVGQGTPWTGQATPQHVALLVMHSG